ncbi:hypothetical protein GCM10023149_09150 [Mucilaginibacter gynuensis]|uniref:Uncharacterized protein n=1 Tax=Mucilaginibacter gynuensis TaxID=1302236 RepID=A0ABP8FYM9_9SPHI
MTDSYPYDLILQCILTASIPFTLYFQIKGDFRARTLEKKKEAKILMWLTGFFTLITICYQILNAVVANGKEEILNASLKSISDKNDSLNKLIVLSNFSLRKKIDTSQAENARIAAEKALIASRELNLTADHLTTIITGSRRPPEFFFEKNVSKLNGLLKNYDKLPANFIVTVIDYEWASICKRTKDNKFIDKSCYLKYSKSQSVSMPAGSLTEIPLPFIIDHEIFGRYQILIDYPDTRFVIQVEYKVEQKVITMSKRILKLNSVLNATQVSELNQLRIDWRKEFDIPLNIVFADFL